MTVMTSKEKKEYARELREFAKNVTHKEARKMAVKAGVLTPKGNLTKNYK